MTNVFIVAHDAGGANILASWARKNFKKYRFLTCLKGPARKVFRQRDLRLKNVSISQYFSQRPQKGDFILTGTSEAALERTVIAKAKKYNVRCASFLDHWINYRQRFLPSTTRAEQKELIKTGRWQAYLPDEVWVGDKPAFQLALKEGFPKDTLRIVENPYFEEIRELAKKKTILYMSSPICDTWEKEFGERGLWKLTEFEQMEMFLKGLEKISGKVGEVIIRLHPKESFNKYDKIIKRYRGKIILEKSKNNELAGDIKKSDIVIGNESMGLVAAILMGKKVFCCLPGRIKKIAIPYKSIIRVNSTAEIADYL